MPFILIVIGVIAALGLGGFMWTNTKEEESIATAAIITTPATETSTTPAAVPVETVTESPVTPVTTPTKPTTVTSAPTEAAKTIYKNGTYSVGVSYKAPDREDHPVTVELTLTNDIVTASNVTFGGEAKGATADFQKKFAATYKTQVIGKSLDSIKLSRVGGASLTTNAWNSAQADITTQAKS